nr:hypothetical protein [Dietzia aerolata]
MEDFRDLLPDLIRVGQFDIAGLDSRDRGVDPIAFPRERRESALYRRVGIAREVLELAGERLHAGHGQSTPGCLNSLEEVHGDQGGLRGLESLPGCAGSRPAHHPAGIDPRADIGLRGSRCVDSVVPQCDQ